MQWQEICDSPLFNDLPFKFETNRWGKIEQLIGMVFSRLSSSNSC